MQDCAGFIVPALSAVVLTEHVFAFASAAAKNETWRQFDAQIHLFHVIIGSCCAAAVGKRENSTAKLRYPPATDDTKHSKRVIKAKPKKQNIIWVLKEHERVLNRSWNRLDQRA